MVQSPGSKASKMVLDGALRKVPGYETGAQDGDQPPVFISSGVVDVSTAAAAINPTVIPFDFTILSVGVSKTTAPAVAATIEVGTVASAARFLSGLGVSTVAGATRTEVIADAAMLATSGDAGDILTFGTNGADTASGVVHIDVVIAPR